MAQETSGLTKYNEEDATLSVKSRPSDTENGDVDNITSEETERLHSEIEETRDSMGETINEIQERLSTESLSAQVSERVGSVIESAKETIYDATLGKVVNFMKETSDGVMQTTAGRTVMRNPIPFALIGAGTAMLIYNGVGRRNRTNGRYESNRSRTPEPQTGGRSSAGLVGGAAETISDTASSAYESVSRVASDTYSGTTDMANRAYEKAGQYGTAAKENYDYYIQEKPLAVAAAAMAVGAAIGLAVPSTTYEGRLMGETRDDLLSKAEGTATELVDKVKEVATDAGQSVSKEIGSRSGTTHNM